MRLRIFLGLAVLVLFVAGHDMAAAQVVLSSSATAITFPATVTLTVVVPAGTAAPATALPVTVTDNTTTVASGTVSCCAATTLTFPNVALATGTHTLSASYVPDPTNPSPITSNSVTVTVARGTPVISWPTPAPVAPGTALGSAQLDATANVPGSFSYNPPAGTVITTGTQVTATFTPTDAVNFSTATATVNITVNKTKPVISWAAPAPVIAGTALSSTQLNATADVPGSFAYSPPAGTVLSTGTHALTATFTPTDTVNFSTATATVNITIVAPQPIATLQGPSTSASAQQPAVTFQASSLPSPTTATFTLTFAADTSPAVDDPAIQFMGGGRTHTEQIPANSTFAKTIAMQTGTVAGTITVKASLTANGSNITPSSLTPVVIGIPPAVPVINSVTLARGTNSIQVIIAGYSDTRDILQAEFQFAAAPGRTLQTTDLIIPASQLFSGWFRSSGSAAAGSAFLYTQPFSLDSDSGAIAFVTVTLTNAQGASAAVTAQ